MNFFQIVFFDPIFNILMLLYTYLGENIGLAIIGVAIITRLITLPLTRGQFKNADKNKAFQSKYQAVKKKYAKNKEKQAEELGKLQMQHLPGQIKGCIPIIFQLIFLIQVRHVIVKLVHEGISSFDSVAYPFVKTIIDNAGITEVSLQFLGMDLGLVASDIGITNFPTVLPYVVLALLVGASQFASTRILTALSGLNVADDEKKKKSSKKKNKKNGEDELDMEEMMKLMNKQMMFLFPGMTMLMSLGYFGGSNFLPAGVSLFWTVQSLFVIIQQVFSRREKIIEKVQGKEDKEPKEKSKSSKKYGRGKARKKSK